MPRMRCKTWDRSKVESTGWPASYRTAILFMRQDHRNVEEAVEQVPKVTGEKAFLREGWVVSLPPSGGADQAIGDDAEPEIDDQAHVELERPMARQGKGRSKKEVRHVAQDDGKQSLNQIYEHWGFRHRGHGAWSGAGDHRVGLSEGNFLAAVRLRVVFSVWIPQSQFFFFSKTLLRFSKNCSVDICVRGRDLRTAEFSICGPVSPTPSLSRVVLTITSP